jgi:hypothetical protein
MRYAKKSRSMKAKSLHTRGGMHTGGARGKKALPRGIGMRVGEHSGGALGPGPHAPSTHTKAARVRKQSGGKRTAKGKLPRRSRHGDARGGRMRKRPPKMDQSVSRDDFISHAEEALGDTEF